MSFLPKHLQRVVSQLHRQSHHYTKTKTIPFENYIENFREPVCKNCKHFIPNGTVPQCKLYGKKDLVTGAIEYQYAAIVRTEEDMCDVSGKHYSKHEFGVDVHNVYEGSHQ